MKMFLKQIDTEKVRKDIEQNGFVILEKLIDSSFIDSQRDRYINFFKKVNVNGKFVRGNLILGEKNFLSYSNIPAWCMYRNFEFLWDKIEDKESFNVHLSIHKLRNRLQGLQEDYGLHYNEDAYGVYLSTSMYEANKGMLVHHSDGHSDTPILHYMLPYTFKGVDYESGGLTVTNKKGETTDIDKIVQKGDVILFDGALVHGVNTIKSKTGIGRIAAFLVPTYFEKDAAIKTLKRRIKIRILEYANKLKIKELQ